MFQELLRFLQHFVSFSFSFGILDKNNWVPLVGEHKGHLLREPPSFWGEGGTPKFGN